MVEKSGFKAYLVGGAVRDSLLGRPVSDRDYVVVGATVENMLSAGYMQVGRDFPVFLHPETKDEHALARTERKSGPGHKGFVVHAASDVTLEEDLERRDLTINAIARDDDGVLTDPFSGLSDIERRVLRHVSPHFAEDPLRILRVARFAAQLTGFMVADETHELMRVMVDNGALKELPAERIFGEMEKALMSSRPSKFFEVLREVGALKVLIPELDALFGVPQPPKHHPEVDSGIHTLMVVDAAARAGARLPARYAALVHDLGKGLTPEHEWPHHHGHESAGVPLADAVSARLKVPSDCAQVARVVTGEHLRMHLIRELRPATALKLITVLGGFRQGNGFEDALAAAQADAQGRKGFENRPYPQAEILRRVRDAALAVDARALVGLGLNGERLGERLAQERIAAIRNIDRTPHQAEPAAPSP